MSKDVYVRCIVPMDALVGESPTWCERKKQLYWIDIRGHVLYCYHPESGKNAVFPLPDLVSAVALCEDENKLLLSMRKTIALFDLPTQTLTTLASIETDQRVNRLNDAKCDPHGRFWVGTMNDQNFANPEGALYRYNTAFECEKMMSGVACANGMGWSPDNKTMYFTDTFHYTVFAFDYNAATGELSHRRVFSALDPKAGGLPDGLTVDSEGYVWSAHPGSGKIVRYSPDGKEDRVIPLPVARGTSCTFGGNDMKTLYVTSARELMTPEEIKAMPLAGSLFAIEMDVVGLPSNRIPKKFYTR